jgi:aminoglycoside 6'-N-acetyltransferase I
MQKTEFLIKSCSSNSQPEWLTLRTALWPDCSQEKHKQDMANFLKQSNRYAQFIAYDNQKTPVGFLEACLRQDYVNGTKSSPVAFIEGIYTVPNMRRHGVASLLMKAVETWAKEKGCIELASDALLENTISHNTHKALGFEETERVIYFRKVL